MAKSPKLVGIYCSSQWIMGFFFPQDVSEACLQCAECTEAEAAEVIEGLQLTGSWVSWQNPSFWETVLGGCLRPGSAIGSQVFSDQWVISP